MRNKAALFLIYTLMSGTLYCQGFVLDKLLHEDDFSKDMTQWIIEQTPDGKSGIRDGQLEIDGGGTTLWFRELLNGPVMIQYEATLIQNGGPNDNCRDLNAFWMARHPRAPYDLFEGWRSNSESRGGSFKNYHELRTYYTGVGGNKNTTTRFRRYTGHGDRPLLPEHDLRDSSFLLKPNKTYLVQLVANGSEIQYLLDGRRLFSVNDPDPYTSGWFGVRTVSNHLKVDNLKIYRIKGKSAVNNSEEPKTEFPGMDKGLREAGSRKGWRVQDLFFDGNYYRSERRVFNDPVTGGLIWQLTGDNAIEKNEYTDIPVWSADGKLMLFITLRNGKAERWIMNADGTNLRPLDGILDIPNGKGLWSIQHPDLLFYSEKDSVAGKVIRTKVISGNVLTGEKRTVLSVKGDLGTMQPPHPSEELFLFGDHMSGKWEDKEHPSRAFVVKLNGDISEISFDKLFHRLRFTKSTDGRVFYNFDSPRTSWTCLPDGSDRIEIKVNGGHPDWLEGGEFVIFNAREELADGTKNFDLRYDAIRYDGTGYRTLYPFGGHASTVADGKHIVCDGGPGAGSVNYVAIDSNNTSQVLFLNQTSRYDHSNKWHPDHHSTHPHPNSSPDGTKVMSNSDVLGQYTDIFVSVARYPDPPLNLSSSFRRKTSLLEWDAPLRGMEIKGYHVYHSRSSGKEYSRLTTVPVQENTYKVSGAAGYYMVTAIEYSGLESRASNEVYYRGNELWEGLVRQYLEAETGKYQLPLEPVMAMNTASNGYVLASRKAGSGGKASYQLDIPVDGEYMFWILVSGGGGLNIEIDGEQQGRIPGSEKSWDWKKTPASVHLQKGKHLFSLVATKGTEKIDKILYTNDASFQPSGHMKPDTERPEVPEKVSAKAVSANSIQVSWDPSPSPDVAYYNVYASGTPDFICGQAYLIGSPPEHVFVDWGLPLNESRYYKVEAVDLAGNKSTPSTTVIGSVIPFVPVLIELNTATPESTNMKMGSSSQTGEPVLSAEEVGESCTWKFSVPREGYYAIWGRSILNRGEIQEFDFQLNGKSSVWNHFGIYNAIKWSPLGDKTTGTPELFYLEKGINTIKVISKGQGIIGNLLLSDDPSFWPVEEMKSTGY